jgi:hypothetical protein
MRSLRQALSEYVDHYHEERNHQGKDNVLYFLGTVTSIESGASNAASDWAGSCVIIIKRPHEKAVRWVF